MSSSQSWAKSLSFSFYISIVFCLASGFNFVTSKSEAITITPACQLPTAAPTFSSISSQAFSSIPFKALSSTPFQTSSPSASYTSGLEGTALNVTNSFRQQHNASALTWDDTLANYAQNWTNGCQWGHSVGDFSFHIEQLQKLLCSSL